MADDYSEILKLSTEIKTCVSNLETTVATSIVSHEKDSDRFFKIIIILIATIGGILGLKIDSPQIASGVGVAVYQAVSFIDWETSLVNFSRYYTIFSLIFTGGSIVQEYWKNGYNKYLGFGFIIMGLMWITQLYGITTFLSPSNVPIRLVYSTLFLIYSFNLGFKREKKQ